ncbi:hypothetical protein BX616_002358 [Lobosporangium transversale]|uniref:Solute carrier family 40 member n=1 Tax=Lobosporangium transversale TaxID=64571 RepID=A0A1Y2GFK5_9FUNG|nr:hypothetical protein BCR41DRAFT_339413 [Lobosporangium transversale]KAF9901156.1 hypothetical protein BX616_002358 [Lobosporangium transversale]ORZ09401.1 hypothetical protein BCR41DRAFT_339413 [Lobosporangium transversale]|eukprot:XP_021878854.1 hypothetical protein BCR41DRAFT_339413 [Lobosporangium transversale]
MINSHHNAASSSSHLNRHTEEYSPLWKGHQQPPLGGPVVSRSNLRYSAVSQSNPESPIIDTDVAENRLQDLGRCMDGDPFRSPIPLLYLYVVHALCTFDERMYEFASYFFIMEIFKNTLLPMSIYGFSTTVAGIILSTTVGSFVDTTPRLKAVQSFLLTQKLTTILSALVFWALLTWFDPSSDIHIPAIKSTKTIVAISEPTLSLYQGYSLFTFLVIASGVLKLSALGWSISIERDWIVSLCQSDSEMLTKINVFMKRIDLVCKLVSPLAFATLLTLLQNPGYCSLVIAAWCMCSFCLELVLVRRIWFNSPILRLPRSIRSHRNNNVRTRRDQKHKKANSYSSVVNPLFTTEYNHDEVEPRRDLLSETESEIAQSSTRKIHPSPSLFRRGIHSFQDYAHHVVFLASLSYAIIYINLMSVSGTMIGYLKWRGLTASSIALLKGVCTCSELLGTILMPITSRYIGLIRSGAWSIWFEVVTLTPVLLSIYSDHLPIQAMIFAGMALSRVGVWSFDLVITQIMQEYVESDANNAGIINGWHYSMMSLFELIQFILTMVWSDPQQYFMPCTLSFVCVIVGAAVYSAYAMRMRGHLFHYHRNNLTAHISPAVAVNEQRSEDDSR